MPQHERRKFEKHLDGLWRQVALLKAGNKCEYPHCHQRDNLNCHHFYSRSRRSTRWDVDNVLVLCATHHSMGPDSAHKSPDFKDVILGRLHYPAIRTEEWYQKLTRRAYTPQKLDLKLVEIDLKQQLKELDLNFS